MPKPKKYDQTFDPPAPTCEIIISTKIPGLIGENQIIGIPVTMLIDTGADMSVIPKSVIESLEKLICRKLPFFHQLVRDFFSNDVFYQKKYYLDIKSSDCDQVENVEFLEVENEEAVIGRNILNEYLIHLDGYQKLWWCN